MLIYFYIIPLIVVFLFASLMLLYSDFITPLVENDPDFKDISFEIMSWLMFIAAFVPLVNIYISINIIEVMFKRIR